MKKIAIIFILALLCTVYSFSADLGLLLDQKVELDNTVLSYTPSLTPWFSWTGNNNISLYFSGFLSMEYRRFNDGPDESNGWLKPLLRPELSVFSLCSWADNFFFEIGRMQFNDTLSVTASGLFDGFSFQFGVFSVGAFYTGFQFKKTAQIVMTAEDRDTFDTGWDWDHFNDYFASKRVIASLRWDIPLFEYHNFSFEAVAQFDLNDHDEKLNSQYGEIALDFYTAANTGISIGAFFEAMETKGKDFTAALGALAGIRTDLPGSLNDSLLLSAMFSSGLWTDTLGAFTPISSIEYSEVFIGTLSGLGLIKAAYDIRIVPSLFAELSAAYFLRAYNDPESDGHAYGAEIWASFSWQPLDDIRFNIGAGAFFPGMGNIYPKNTDTMWKLSAGLSISL